MEFHGKETNTLIHGAARGADTIAAEIAYDLDWIIERYPADWDVFGKAAGRIRNKQMLVEGKPDVVLAFWDGQSRGTANMIALAESVGVKVRVFREEKPCE